MPKIVLDTPFQIAPTKPTYQMDKQPPIDLYTFSIIYNDDRDKIVQGLLRMVVELEQVRILLNHCMTKQPVQNAVRYLIGRYLNTRYDSVNFIDLHVEWVDENLSINVHKDRRLRRHARSVDAKVAEGIDILEVLKMPALILRDSKSRKDREVQENLDALRNLRDDRQSKIVSKK